MIERYQEVIRVAFAVVFISGSLVHFVLGRVLPESYAAFGDSALFGCLHNLWGSFVMPNIGWLTIVLGLYEFAVGVSMSRKSTVIIAAWGAVIFLVFITILGYGFPATSFGEDLLKNRVPTIVMTALSVPLLVKGHKDVANRSNTPTKVPR